MTRKERKKKMRIELNTLLMQVANNQGGIETQPQSMQRIKLQRELLKLEADK